MQARTLFGIDSTKRMHKSLGISNQSLCNSSFNWSTFVNLASDNLWSIHDQIFSIGFKSGDFAGQSITVTFWSLNHTFTDLAVCAVAPSCWKIQGCCHNYLMSDFVWYRFSPHFQCFFGKIWYFEF